MREIDVLSCPRDAMKNRPNKETKKKWEFWKVNANNPNFGWLEDIADSSLMASSYCRGGGSGVFPHCV